MVPSTADVSSKENCALREITEREAVTTKRSDAVTRLHNKPIEASTNWMAGMLRCVELG